MSTPPDADPIARELDARWRAERQVWARELRGLALDAEPLEEQLARRRAASLVLVGLSSGVALAFFALFAAFDRPFVGLGVAAAGWLPIVGFSQYDLARLTRRVRAYQAAYEAYRAARESTGAV